MASPSKEDAEDFVGKVDEVSRLVHGLSRGTLTPEYIDAKMGREQAKSAAAKPKVASPPVDARAASYVVL